jgi:parallel beta-helix repeat protein
MANYYVTVAGAGTNSGADWANAFDLAAFITHSTVSASAGDVYYIMSGTYTFTSVYSNALDQIAFIGVTTGTTNEPPTYADYAYGTDRPLFDGGSDYFFFDNYWLIRNLRFTSSSSIQTIDSDVGNVFFNCDIANTNASPSYGIYIAEGLLVDCKITADASVAIINFPSGAIKNCYITGDGAIGIRRGGRHHAAIGNIINGPDIGISAYNDDFNMFVGNTIYGCATYGIDLVSTKHNIVYNNTISNCGTGIKGSSSILQAHIDYNNYYNNTTDVDGVTKGPNALAVNPNFTDAASGDFSLASASDLIGAGFGIRLGVG